MSRSVLQKEAESNTRHRQWMTSFLFMNANNPIEFQFGTDFQVWLVPKGKPPVGPVALESVPVIKQHLHETGALKLLYEGIEADTLEELERVRGQLGVAAPSITLNQKDAEYVLDCIDIVRREGLKAPMELAARIVATFPVTTETNGYFVEEQS